MRRTILHKTLSEIIKRDYREASRGRGTYYRVNYFTYKGDDRETAKLQTKNKVYEFRECKSGIKYKLNEIEYKNLK